ncbi:MAG: hypothetical protein K9M75_04180 [Phycisphaerae bacterium]|nr:hypothetical protein [Phycisphaerae bacterium]
MDAEHRHELKTNELADWIAHFPEFLKKNRNQILGVILIIAGIISYFGYRTRSLKVANKEQVEATQQMQMMEKNKIDVIQSAMAGDVIESPGFADSASALEVVAEKVDQPLHAAMALIKRGEALRAELHYASQDPDKDKIASNIELAKKAYDQALIKAKGDATLTAMATYGLGLCEEEIGDFNKAAEIFKGIAANEDFKGTIFPAQALFRLDVMDDHKEQFTFVAAPAPEMEVPEGFDKSAIDALMRGDIHMEGVSEDKKPITTPPVVVPEDTTPPTVTPQPKPESTPEPKPTTEPKPEPKPDTETKTGDTTDEGKVYEVGPQPAKAPDTE